MKTVLTINFLLIQFSNVVNLMNERSLFVSQLCNTVNRHDNWCDDIIDRFSLVHFDPGEIIVPQGGICTNRYFPINGISRLYLISPEGKEVTTSFIRRGNFISSVRSILFQEPSSFTAQALTPCSFMKIDGKNMEHLKKTNPDWLKFVLSLYDDYVVKKEIREESFLILDAEQRYLAFLKEYGEDASLIKNNQVAKYLGITNVFLSKIRARMKECE